MADLTAMLDHSARGEPAAAEELLPLVYHELRKLAAVRFIGEPAQTLQPTALVHEVWLRLGHDQQRRWCNRAHFFATAAEAMRHILIDRARSRQAERHGGGLARVDFDAAAVAAPPEEDRILAVNDALERFAAGEPRMAELVKLRYFAGFTLEESAEALEISPATAKRWWSYASAWLRHELKPA
jgi:RNA polymerase sigma factor (TIGR02999 family)